MKEDVVMRNIEYMTQFQSLLFRKDKIKNKIEIQNQNENVINDNSDFEKKNEIINDNRLENIDGDNCKEDDLEIKRRTIIGNDKKGSKKRKREQEINIDRPKLFFEKYLKSSDELKSIPLKREEEFLSHCPVRFFKLQLEAIRWMNEIENSNVVKDKSCRGGILADVMGLGKTISCLGLIFYDLFIDGCFKEKTLIIATVSLLENWFIEATEKFGIDPSEIFLYHGSERKSDYNKLEKDPKIVITNYETMSKEYGNQDSWMFQTHWKRVLADEVHIARNPKTKIFKSLENLKSTSFWCITGTPIVNYPEDIKTLSKLATPTHSLETKSFLKEDSWKKRYILRRTKKELNLPKLDIREIWLEFSKTERRIYSEIESFTFETIEDINKESNDNQMQSVLKQLIKLRQLCNDGLILSGGIKTKELLKKTKEDRQEIIKNHINKESNSQIIPDLNECEKSTKMKYILDLISKIKKDNADEKIVIFTQFVSMINVIEHYLIKANYHPLRLDGNVIKSSDRSKIVNNFTKKKECDIILVSLKAGGVGVTLVPANHLIMVDPWWNLAVEKQAYDRVHRIGQKKEVVVYRLFIKNTIEEDILKIQKSKSNRENKFLDKEDDRILNRKDIENIIKRNKK